METIFIIASIVIPLLIVWAIYTSISDSRRKAKSSSLLRNKYKTMVPRNILTSDDGSHAVGIEEVHHKIIYKDSSNNIVEYSYSDLSDCELLVDGKTKKATSTKSVIGASIGYSIAGATGFILGAIAGASTDKIKIKTLVLKLTFTKDGVTKSHIISLFNGGFVSIEINKEPAKSALKQTNEWLNKLKVIIEKKD